MALAGGRAIEHEGHRYEWVLRRRGPSFRAVVQDADARGQLLVAYHPVYWLCEMNEARGDYYKRTRVGTDLIRGLIVEARGNGRWRPECRGLPPCRLGSPGRWPPGEVGVDCLDGLWSLLDALCRAPEWRARLAGNTGEFIPVTAAEVRGADPALWGRVEEAGPLVVHVRPANYHGDATPHLAIRSLAWGRDVVLEEISDWHHAWRPAEPGAAPDRNGVS